MAAPVLANRSVVFVNKVGSDDAGLNAVGSPQSHLTIVAALADLAANYPAASSTNFHICSVGPGVYAEAAIALPPWTWIIGGCDGQEGSETVVSLADATADVTLSAGWSSNSTKRGGLIDLTFRAASSTPIIDFTMPVPAAGNPSRTVECAGLKHNLTQMLFEATSTADVWQMASIVQDGINTDVITQTGGTSRFNNVVAAALTTIQDKALFATAGNWQGLTISDAASGLRVISTVAAGTTLRFTNSSVRALTMSETAPGVVAASADGASIPIRSAITYTGTAVSADLTRLNDANSDAYTPAVSGDWPAPDPVTVQEALDMIAAGGGGSAGNRYGEATNAAGNTTITPTGSNYTFFLTVTVADARTSVAILSTATPPTQGDVIDLTCVSAIAGVTIEVRNATAGGTLLATFDTGDVSRKVGLVFTGAAGTPASAWKVVEDFAPAYP